MDICPTCNQRLPSDRPTLDPYQIALGEMGVKEYPGEADNPRILEYHRETSLKATDDEVSWCSSFICWAMERAGIPSTRSAAARSWLKWGKKIDTPVEGCVVVFWRSSPKSWKGHVGFFVRAEGDSIVTLGGNQSNKVGLSEYPKDRVLGYRIPVI